MKFSFKLVLALLALTLAHAALAAGAVNPPGYDAWDLYVSGNGEAIYEILHSIAMMVGSSDFRTLLLLVSTIGFFVLAVKAGFDPGRNLGRMFGYLLLCYLIVTATTGLKSNVTINDRVTGYYNTAVGVPTIIAVPASLVSEAGHWITEQLEQFYTVPGALTLSGKGGPAGTYGIFAKMMQDASSFHISNQGLKKSLTAYISDCAVPAIALGRMHTDDLVHSTDLMATLQSAASEAHLTRYYPGESYVSGPGAQQGESQPLTCAPGVTVKGQEGALLSCKQAYGCLSDAMGKHADGLLNAAASSWADTGVMTPLATELGAALSWASGGIDTGVDTGTTSPASFVKQRAMISAMTGAFRGAAMQSNNNEMLTAASIAQAEQNQKSFWVSSATIFHNMMGYIYTVLQALIYALAPVVIVAFFVPGMGGRIAISYGEILVWLALWEPMLSVVNYLIALFGKQTIGSTFAQWGGLSMQDAWTISSQANDLMIAASFMATMTPLLAWGLVKGSMAFTELISHGIGAQYAAQAGAAMGSGNVGLNNMQMDNINTSKYNTASSITVGSQGVNSLMGAGAATTTRDAGGSVDRVNATNVALPHSRQVTHSRQMTYQEQVQKGKSFQTLVGDVKSWSHGQNAGDNKNAAETTKRGLQAIESFAAKNGITAQQAVQDMDTYRRESSAGAKLSKDGKLGAGLSNALMGVLPLSANGHMGVDNSAGTSAAHSKQGTSTDNLTQNHGIDHGGNVNVSGGKDASVGSNSTAGSSAAFQEIGNFAHQAVNSGLVTNAWSYGESNTVSWTDTVTVQGGALPGGIGDYIGATTPSGFEHGGFDAMHAEMGAEKAGVVGGYNSNLGAGEAARTAGQDALTSLTGQETARANPITGVLSSQPAPDTGSAFRQASGAIGNSQAKQHANDNREKARNDLTGIRSAAGSPTMTFVKPDSQLDSSGLFFPKPHSYNYGAPMVRGAINSAGDAAAEEARRPKASGSIVRGQRPSSGAVASAWAATTAGQAADAARSITAPHVAIHVGMPKK